MNTVNTIADQKKYESTITFIDLCDESNLHNYSNNIITFIASKTELPQEIVIELFKKFINNSETILTQLDKQHDDLPALKIAIHSLKGISRNLYLEGLGTLCEAFEKELLSLTADQKQEHLQEIKEETNKNIQQMKKELV